MLINHYKIRPNQELVALGAMNILGSFVSSFTTTGGFSRTAVNANTGAKTQVAGIISGTLVGFCLLFLTKLFYYIPKTALAAIVIQAVFGLIDYNEFIELWKIKKIPDFLILTLTFTITLFVSIEIGIFTAMVISFVIIMWTSSRPTTGILGRLPGTKTYSNMKDFPYAITSPGTLVFTVYSSLYYVNCSHFEDWVKQVISNTRHSYHSVVIDCSFILEMDASAARMLIRLNTDLKSSKCQLYFACVKPEILVMFKSSGIENEVGLKHITQNVHDAVINAEALNPKVENSESLIEEVSLDGAVNRSNSSSEVNNNVVFDFAEPSLHMGITHNIFAKQ